VRESLGTRPDLIVGVPHLLGSGVRRLLAPNAGRMTGPGTNTYMLGSESVTVLDPGPDDASHLEAILAAGGGTIRWIVVTHTHRDHSPLAAVLAARTGARLIGMPPPGDGRQDLSFTPEIVPRDGEALRLDGVHLTAIHTPGHASNCLCYLHEGERLLFTGDHVLEGASPVILAPDGDMTAYLESLDKLGALAFDRIAPGHGGILERGKRAVAALRVHRLAREGKILRALSGKAPAALEGLTAAVYDDVSPDLHAWAKLTLEAHLIKLVRDGRVILADGRWQLRGE
jgi:glyoxylase-like metal-dependent hydrolase (beta-lactamase superfamily II)